MTGNGESRSEEHVMAVLERTAVRHENTPAELVRKIIEHERAVQFDEKRYEASNYIRSLVFEFLESESQ
jgi:hypothetical protein